MGVPIIRIVVFGGLYWGPPILVNYNLGIAGQVGVWSVSGLGRKKQAS